MKSAVFASIREGAGKTSLLVGIMSTLEKKYGYIKPIGDRLIYKRKRNRDYDSDLMTRLFELEEEPESITLGFDQSKLRYMYDDNSLVKKISGLIQTAGKGKDGVFIEAGKDVFYGASLNLDPVSLAKNSNSSLILIVSGDNQSILDELTFAKNNLNLQGLSSPPAVIINKAHDADEFETFYLEKIQEQGYKILGVVPFKEQLSHYTINYMAERLYAKVIAGEKGTDKIIKNIFVGAMSTDETLRNPIFNKKNKFLITSGDRSDMILAALESDTMGILLTNNIVPPSHIISTANDKNIPLLLVTMDTFNAARQIGRLESLLTAENEDAIRLLTQITEKYIDIDKIFG